MVKNILIALTLLIMQSSGFAQTIWDGPTVVFAKADNADWTLPENQDWILDNYQITRKNTMGIFNIAQENGYQNFVSPASTEWAMGTTAAIDELEFYDWKTAVGANPQLSIDLQMVLHLIVEDIYIDIRFTDWSNGSQGGGFGYKRSSESPLSINNVESNNILISPNPGKSSIQIEGIKTGTLIVVYDQFGKRVEVLKYKTAIDITNWPSGLYILRIESYGRFKFIKT